MTAGTKLRTQHAMYHNSALLEKFVSLFEEDAVEDEFTGPLVSEQRTDASALNDIYSKIPAKFPPLYELLVLSYRWYGADIQKFRLLPNKPGSDSLALYVEMFNDDAMAEECLKAGFVQFGKGPDCNYDPVCFDTNKPTPTGDYPIVRLDHEQILCYSRIRVVATLAPSFEELVRAMVTQ